MSEKVRVEPFELKSFVSVHIVECPIAMNAIAASTGRVSAASLIVCLMISFMISLMISCLSESV